MIWIVGMPNPVGKVGNGDCVNPVLPMVGLDGRGLSFWWYGGFGLPFSGIWGFPLPEDGGGCGFNGPAGKLSTIEKNKKQTKPNWNLNQMIKILYKNLKIIPIIIVNFILF